MADPLEDAQNAAREFAIRLGSGQSQESGVPKPPLVEVFETKFPLNTFMVEAGATSNQTEESSRTPIPFDCATDCPPNCDDCPTGCDEADLLEVTGAVNGVPATLNVCSDGSGWAEI